MMRQLVRIFAHESMAALRSRRVLAVAALFLGSGLFAATIFFRGVEQMKEAVAGGVVEDEASRELVRGAIDSQSSQILESTLSQVGMELAQIAAPLRQDLVAPVLLFFILLLLPMLVALAAFDTLSTDLSRRTLAYETVRVPRGVAVLGRAAAQWALVLAVTLLGAAGAYVVAANHGVGVTFAGAAGALAYILVLLAPYTAAYVGIATWASSTTTRPLIALILILAMTTGLQIVRGIGSRWHESDHPLGPIRFVSPSAWRRGLWSSDPGELLLSMFAFLAFAALFSWLAIMRVRRRDL